MPFAGIIASTIDKKSLKKTSIQITPNTLKSMCARAARLATGPTMAYAMTKRMINNEWNMDLVSAIEHAAQAQALLMMGEDHRIFYEAFKNKQDPKWIGR